MSRSPRTTLYYPSTEDSSSHPLSPNTGYTTPMSSNTPNVPPPINPTLRPRSSFNLSTAASRNRAGNREDTEPPPKSTSSSSRSLGNRARGATDQGQRHVSEGSLNSATELAARSSKGKNAKLPKLSKAPAAFDDVQLPLPPVDPFPTQEEVAAPSSAKSVPPPLPSPSMGYTAPVRSPSRDPARSERSAPSTPGRPRPLARNMLRKPEHSEAIFKIFRDFDEPLSDGETPMQKVKRWGRTTPDFSRVTILHEDPQTYLASDSFAIKALVIETEAVLNQLLELSTDEGAFNLFMSDAVRTAFLKGAKSDWEAFEADCLVRSRAGRAVRLIEKIVERNCPEDKAFSHYGSSVASPTLTNSTSFVEKALIASAGGDVLGTMGLYRGHPHQKGAAKNSRNELMLDFDPIAPGVTGSSVHPTEQAFRDQSVEPEVLGTRDNSSFAMPVRQGEANSRMLFVPTWSRDRDEAARKALVGNRDPPPHFDLKGRKEMSKAAPPHDPVQIYSTMTQTMEQLDAGFVGSIAQRVNARTGSTHVGRTPVNNDATSTFGRAYRAPMLGTDPLWRDTASRPPGVFASPAAASEVPPRSSRRPSHIAGRITNLLTNQQRDISVDPDVRTRVPSRAPSRQQYAFGATDYPTERPRPRERGGQRTSSPPKPSEGNGGERPREAPAPPDRDPPDDNTEYEDERDRRPRRRTSLGDDPRLPYDGGSPGYDPPSGDDGGDGHARRPARRDRRNPNPPPRGPYIKTEIKFDLIPKLESWKGVMDWIFEISNIVRMGGTLETDVASIIPLRLSGGPAQWFNAISEAEKVLLTTSWTSFYQGVVTFLGDRWVQSLREEYAALKFRQAGHEREDPWDFVIRKIRLNRMVMATPVNPADDVSNIMMNLPLSWGTWLREGEIGSVDHLLRLVRLYEPQIKEKHEELQNLEYLMSRSRWSSYRSNASKTATSKTAHLAAVEEEELAAEEDVPPDVAASALAVGRPSPDRPSDKAGKRSSFKPRSTWEYKPPPGGHPFPRDDSTRSKNPPRYPCQPCGSPFHYNRDCKHYADYTKKEALSLESVREVARPPDVQLDYEAEYFYDNFPDPLQVHRTELLFDPVILPGQTSRAAHCFTVRPFLDFDSLPGSRLDKKETPRLKEVAIAHVSMDDDPYYGLPDLGFVSESDVSDAETEEDPSLNVGKPNVKTKVRMEEVLDREAGVHYSGSALSAESSHLLEPETVSDPAPPLPSSATVPTVDDPSTEEPEEEEEALPEGTRRYSPRALSLHQRRKGKSSPTPPRVLHPPKARTSPDGLSCVGVTALILECKAGSSGRIIRARLDSGADISLCSEATWRSLKHPPRLRQGLKMKLYQLTNSALMLGYFHLPIWVKDTEGRNVCLDTEVYVVPGMQVPLLLGMDFHLDYRLKIDHGAHPHPSVQIGDTDCTLIATAAKVESVFGAFHIIKKPPPPTPLPEKPVEEQSDSSASSKKTPPPPTERTRPSFLVAAEDVVLGARSFTNVRVTGPMEGRKEWVAEKIVVWNRNSEVLSAPTSLVSAEHPVLSLANFSDRPRLIRKGEKLASLHKPDCYLDKPLNKDQWTDWCRRSDATASLVSARLARDQGVESQASSDTKPFASRDSEEEEEGDLLGPKATQGPSLDPLPSSELEELIDCNPDAPPWARKEFYDLARKRVRAFGFDGRLGHLDAKAHIRTADGQVPIAGAMYQSSPAKREFIDAQLDAWFEQEVIEKSISPWAAPVVIVYRNGKPRFCVDYRKLNAVTIGDEHPIPRQTEIMQALSGAQILSSMDALAGFTQLEIAEEDREKTAFRTHRGLFQFRRMPFGLRNGPAIFQRVMQGILAPFLWLFALVYIDDIIVYSTDWKEHLEHLDLVLEAMEKAGITMSPTKCHFLYTSVLLLGQKVSRLGFSTHLEKVQAVLDLARPTKVSELQTFLGMLVYFSQYIPRFSHLAAPLFSLLRKGVAWEWNSEQEAAWRKAKEALSEAPVLGHPVAGSPYRLYTDASDVALGCCLQQVQTIATRDLKGTKLYDQIQAAYTAGEAVPSFVKKVSSTIKDVPDPPAWAQDWEDTLVPVERVIAYWSRTFKPAETRYSTTEREALGAKEGLVKFQPFIEGEWITLITDHAALQWARTYENLNRRLAAWGAVFSSYQPRLDIVHRAGRVHSNVDPLSRLARVPFHQSPLPPAGEEVIQLGDKNSELPVVPGRGSSEPAARVSASLVDLEASALAMTTRFHEQKRPVIFENRKKKKKDPPETDLTQPSDEPAVPEQAEEAPLAADLSYQDAEDPTIAGEPEKKAPPIPRRRKQPDELERDSGETLLAGFSDAYLTDLTQGYQEDPYFKEKWASGHLGGPGSENLGIRNKQASRFHKGDDGTLWFRDASDNLRLCIPKGKLRDDLLCTTHESPFESAHAGGVRLYQRLALKYFWPNMRTDAISFAQSCDVCQKTQPDRRRPAGFLKPLDIPTRPFQVVSLDLITGLPESLGFTAILVITCKLTKYALFIPTNNGLSSLGFAKLFVEQVVCRFGLPEVIVSDRDGRWISAFWRDVTKFLGVKSALSSARHPQTDGQTERLNQTLEITLRAYTAGDRKGWANWLPMLAHAYNSTPHASTGYSPYFLLMGFEPRGPVDVVGGIGPAVGRPSEIDRDSVLFIEALRREQAKAVKSLPPRKPVVAPSDSEAFLVELAGHRQCARDAMALASAAQARAYNKGRREEILEPGDLVLVNPHSLELSVAQGPGKKLVQKYIGPFEVQARVSDTVYDLRLPSTYSMSSIINIQHLKRYRPSAWKDIERQSLPELAPHLVPSDEYEVDRILTHSWSRKDNRIKYYVRWAGYGAEHDSWIALPQMGNAKQLLREYHEREGLGDAAVSTEEPESVIVT